MSKLDELIETHDTNAQCCERLKMSCSAQLHRDTAEALRLLRDVVGVLQVIDTMPPVNHCPPAMIAEFLLLAKDLSYQQITALRAAGLIGETNA